MRAHVSRRPRHVAGTGVIVVGYRMGAFMSAWICAAVRARL